MEHPEEEIIDNNCDNKGYFGEQYYVKINYKKPDGYWVYGKLLNVIVAVKSGVNEKNNHDKAERLVLAKYPDAKIVTVTYC